MVLVASLPMAMANTLEAESSRAVSADSAIGWIYFKNNEIEWITITGL